jgi:hypothetical protein
MFFGSTKIMAAGDVALRGGPIDSAHGWRLGFIQAQWIETNWCSYKGQSNSDGSVFVQRARPPARPSQACLDCVDGSPISEVFYNTLYQSHALGISPLRAVFPVTLRATHYDKPGDSCKLTEPNSRTGKLNYLAEVQLDFHFCTILTLQDPLLAFHHQQHFYWNVRWQYTFRPSSFTVPPASMNWNPKKVAAGTGADVGKIHRGNPLDRRFAGVLGKRQTRNCNDVFLAARAATDGGANRHESLVWTNFDVTQP